MLFENVQPQNEKEEILTTNLSIAKDGSEVIFPDEETIQKELERYRLYLISKHLPDHCVQFIYLS
ncbi:MAG TPA: hypothetical protein VHB70_13460 [Parafilimonas sp.]|nr:hypothetical protein [Parafilimonas sp.]